MSLLKRLFGTRSSAAAVLTVHQYADRYAGTVRRALPDMEVEVEHGATAALTKVHWVAEDGFKATDHFSNWYARYLQSPSDLDRLLQDQLETALAVRSAASRQLPDTECILPVIKTSAWKSTTDQQLANFPESRRPAVWPLAGDLLLAYVEDMPSAMNYVTPATMERLGLNAESLHALALDNLARRLPRLDLVGDDGRYGARLDGNYDASMILLFSSWRDRLQIAGDPVVALAARDELLICGSDDARAVAELREMAVEITSGAAYPLSSQLFAWREGSLQSLNTSGVFGISPEDATAVVLHSPEQKEEKRSD